MNQKERPTQPEQSPLFIEPIIKETKTSDINKRQQYSSRSGK